MTTSIRIGMSHASCVLAPVVAESNLKLWMSNTHGASWLQPIQQPLGPRGRYNVDISFRRLGTARDRIHALEWTADGNIVLLGAYLSYKTAGT